MFQPYIIKNHNKMKTYDPSTQLRANFLSVLLQLPWCLLLSHTLEVPVILSFIFIIPFPFFINFMNVQFPCNKIYPF